jgi:hypothetical protein
MKIYENLDKYTVPTFLKQAAKLQERIHLIYHIKTVTTTTYTSNQNKEKTSYGCK